MLLFEEFAGRGGNMTSCLQQKKYTCGTPANGTSAVSAASELQAITEILTELFG